MNSDSYVERLLGRDEMARFDEAELRTLITACELRVLPVSTPLWVTGELRTHAFVLLSGSIERHTKTHAGRIVTQHNSPGMLLSLSALVKPWEYHSSAHALEPTEVLGLRRSTFEAMFEARESVAYKLVDAIGEYLVGDMRKANGRLQDVFGHPAETLMMLRRRVREDSKA